VNDPRTFFQIAASLIPALIFGGLISERLSADRLVPGHSEASGTKATAIAFVAALVAAGIFVGEVKAVGAALTGEASRLTAWWVSAVLVIGTGAAVVALAWPWVQPLLPSASRTASRGTWTALALLIGALGYTTIYLPIRTVADAVTVQQTVQRELQLVNSIRRQERQSVNALHDAMERDIRARMAAGLIPRKVALRMLACDADKTLTGAIKHVLEVVGLPSRADRVTVRRLLSPAAC
jgi:hypothetical protein